MPEIMSRTADADAYAATGWPVVTMEDGDAPELLAEILDGLARWLKGTRRYMAQNPAQDDLSAQAAYLRGLRVCSDQVQELINREMTV